MPTAARTTPAKRKPAPKKPAKPKVTIEELLEMPQADLDKLFKASPEGPIPTGEGEGTVIVATGTRLTPLLAPVLHLAWQGKIIDKAGGTLKNRILPFGIPLIAAKVYEDDSKLDGKPATILDYSHTSLVARAIRDEIREVAPGLYLGVVYIYGRKTVNFALQF